MRFTLSAAESYGTGYHLVLSYQDWKNSLTFFDEYVIQGCTHSLVAFHTHGFRHHLHIAVWTKKPNFYKVLKSNLKNVHVDKITKTYSSYEHEAKEVKVTMGYQRVIDYILREPVMHIHRGALQEALNDEYFKDLNKVVRKEEKEAYEFVTNTNREESQHYPTRYYFIEALAKLGLTPEEYYGSEEQLQAKLDIDEEELDRNLM